MSAGTVTFNDAYTFPAIDAGVSGYVLSSNASGTLSWIAQSGGVSGTGTTGYITKWTTGGTVLGDSVMIESSAKIGINTSPSANCHVQTNAAGTVGIIAQASLSQTANLTQWRNSVGTVMSFVEYDGSVGINTSGTTGYWLEVDPSDVGTSINLKVGARGWFSSNGGGIWCDSTVNATDRFMGADGILNGAIGFKNNNSWVIQAHNNGTVEFNEAYTFPATDSLTADYVLQTDGAGTLSWVAQGVTSAHGSAGAIQFNDGSGNFTSDVSNFKYDVVNDQLLMSGGTNIYPAYSFNSDTGSGMYRSVNGVGLVINGEAVIHSVYATKVITFNEAYSFPTAVGSDGDVLVLN